MTGRVRPRFPLVFAATWLLLSLLMGSWAFATPIGAAPDEPAHLIKAASVARGELIGERGPQGEIMQVPAYIAYTHAQTCYTFSADISADCITEVPGSPTALVDAPTTAGLYNPVYYILTGWPSLIAQDSSGIYAMRLVSGLVVALLFAISVALVATWRRPVIPMIGLAAAITPMTLFLGGTVNPNSVEIAATLTAFVAVLSVVRDPDAGSLPARATIVFGAAALAANMRGLSLLWLSIAMLAPLLLASPARIVDLAKKRPVQLAAGGTLLAVIAAAIWLLSTNSLGAALDDPGPVTNAPGVGTSALFGFVWTLFLTFNYAQGLVGIFGWLDTPAPQFVYFTWSLIAGGLLLLGAILLRGRALLLGCVLLAAVVLLPPILQGIYITEGGVIWQGRYILPLFVCLVVGIGALVSDHITLDRRTTIALLFAVLPLWGVAQFQSFATAMRRYAVGLDGGWRDLLDPQWSPPGGVLPLLALHALLLITAAVALMVYLRRPQQSSLVPPASTLENRPGTQ